MPNFFVPRGQAGGNLEELHQHQVREPGAGHDGEGHRQHSGRGQAVQDVRGPRGAPVPGHVRGGGGAGVLHLHRQGRHRPDREGGGVERLLAVRYINLR